MAKKPALLPPGCTVLRICQLSHHLSPDRWPLMGVAQNPSQKGCQALPLQEGMGWGRGG